MKNKHRSPFQIDFFCNYISPASSRSSSPTPRGSYITHTSGHTGPLTPSRPRKAASNPRSQGTSRETSPSRSVKSSGYGQSSGYGKELDPLEFYELVLTQ